MDSSNAVKSGISISLSEPLLNGARQRTSFFFGSIPDRNQVLKIVRGFWSQIRTPAQSIQSNKVELLQSPLGKSKTKANSNGIYKQELFEIKLSSTLISIFD